MFFGTKTETILIEKSSISLWGKNISSESVQVPTQLK